MSRERGPRRRCLCTIRSGDHTRRQRAVPAPGVPRVAAVDVSGRIDELADGTGGSVDAVTGVAIGPYWKSGIIRLVTGMAIEVHHFPALPSPPAAWAVSAPPPLVSHVLATHYSRFISHAGTGPHGAGNHIVCRRRIALDLNEKVQAHGSPGVEVVQGMRTDLSALGRELIDVVFASNFFERSLVEALRLAGLKPTEVRPRFLPFTSKSALPQHPFLVRLYLKITIAQRLLGQQSWIVAVKP